MLSLPVAEVRDRSAPVTTPLTPLMRDVLDLVAPIYQNDPGWFTNTPLGQAQQLTRYLFDNLFRNKPLPPPAGVLFSGGQCACTIYDVRIRTDNFGVNGGITSSTQTVRRLAGAITGLGQEPRPTPTQPDYVRWYIGYNVGCGGSGMEKSFTSAGELRFIRDTIVSVTRVSGPDTCGNPQPSDPPARNAPLVNVNVNIPEIRVSPSATIVVPVVIAKPEFNFSPNLNFNMKFDLGGITVNFDGINFTTSETNISTIVEMTNSINSNTSTAITASQTSITSNVNASIASSQTAINNNTNTRITNSQTAINNNTNTSITNSQTAINNNTNTSINSAVTAINNNTTLQVNNARTDINAAINVLRVDLSAQLQFIANLTGVINADVKLALEFLRTINNKPDCPEPLPPPDEVPEPPITQPPDDGDDSQPKKKLAYVEVILTKLPHKMQYGNGGAQNVYFAGWLAFRSATNSFHERQQINFQRSIFEAPRGSDGYTYTLTHGARGTIKEYYV